MRGSGQTWLRRAIGATTWLVFACGAGACTGPGLETPGDRGGDGVVVDGGDGPGGTGATGGTGGSDGGIPNLPGDGDGDGDGDGVDNDGADAGEAERDASVDDDGGTDPQDLEP